MKSFTSDYEKKLYEAYKQDGLSGAIAFSKISKEDSRKNIVSKLIVVFELFQLFPEISCSANAEADSLADDYPVDAIAEFLVRKHHPELKDQDKKNKRDLLVRYIKSRHPSSILRAVDYLDKPNKDEVEVTPNGAFFKQELKPDGTMDSEKRDLIPRDALEDFREKCKSERYLLELHGLDPDEFEITSYGSSMWEQGENVKYSSRIKAKKRALSPKDLFELTQQLIHEGVSFPVVPKKNYPKLHDTRNIAIVSIADLHLGRLSWGEETGENYDMKIARARFYYIINQAIARMKKEGNIEKIVFFWSQDFFNFDTTEGTTTRGTHLDTDIRWKKLFRLGVEMLVKAISMFEEIAPVETFYSRSNHDEMMGFYAVNYLYAWFKDNANVEVDIGPQPRKYIRYGTNLFGFAHGDKEGKRIKNVMPVEAPSMWGQTTYREYFLGHVHHEVTYEEGGVMFRHLQTPVGTDAYEKESGFLGANKAAQLFVRDYNYGPVAQFELVIPKNITGELPQQLYETP